MVGFLLCGGTPWRNSTKARLTWCWTSARLSPRKVLRIGGRQTARPDKGPKSLVR